MGLWVLLHRAQRPKGIILLSALLFGHFTVMLTKPYIFFFLVVRHAIYINCQCVKKTYLRYGSISRLWSLGFFNFQGTEWLNVVGFFSCFQLKKNEQMVVGEKNDKPVQTV